MCVDNKIPTVTTEKTYDVKKSDENIILIYNHKRRVCVYVFRKFVFTHDDICIIYCTSAIVVVLYFLVHFYVLFMSVKSRLFIIEITQTCL